MRKVVAAVTAALMVSCWAATAFAAANDRCAKPEDITAMQADAVQQQLMVAALSCEAVPLYNSFVTAYQPELFAADKQLMRFFKRMKPRGGELDYHSFKTRMANMASTLSIHDITTFCANAKAAFSLALGPSKSTLAAFVATQPIIEATTVESCEFRVAGGMLPRAPKVVPVPIMKPGDEASFGATVANVVTAPVRAVTGVVTSIFSHLPPFRGDSSTH